MASTDFDRKQPGRTPERVLGIIGYPLEHTLSPAMHNAAFEASGLDWIYAAFKVPPGGALAAVGAMRALGLGGLSVTIPHKEAVVGAVDLLAPEARATGAVNTLSWASEGRELVGSNTDVEGFTKGLEASLGIGLEGRSMALLGAGGAARAVLWAGVIGGARRIAILARTPSRAAEMVRRIADSAIGKSSISATVEAPRSHEREKTSRGTGGSAATSYNLPHIEVFSMQRSAVEEALSESDLLVNATPVGSDGTSIPVSDSAIHERLYVYDLIYFPPRTPLVEAGIRRGAGAASGLEMLVFQGARQFEIWTGLLAPIEAMRRAAREALEATL